MITTVLLSVGSISCSSDGDDDGSASYTSDQIVALLKGKWDIYGHVNVALSGSDRYIDGDYTGTIKFTNAQEYIITSSEIPYELDGKNYNTNLSEILGSYFNYSIFKKDGKNYISFVNGMYNFQIQSLQEKSFKFVEDEYIESKDPYGKNVTVYCNITMFSKDDTDEESGVVGTWMGYSCSNSNPNTLDKNHILTLIFNSDGTGKYILKETLDSGTENITYEMESSTKGKTYIRARGNYFYFEIEGNKMYVYDHGYGVDLDYLLTKQ